MKKLANRFNAKNFKNGTYFTVYDLEDNLILYIDNWVELIDFTKIRLSDLIYKFNNKKYDYILIKYNKKFLKVYAF